MPLEPRASWFSPKCVEAQQLTGHLGVKHCFGAGRESGFFDISVIDGYNVGLDFSPASGSSSSCHGIRCASDSIITQCPSELKADGGCNNACTVFKTDEYCCNSGSCGETNYSKFFKNICPDAYSYPKDDQTSTFTCPAGTNYRVTFCPT